MKHIFILSLFMLALIFSVSAQSGSNTTTKKMKTPSERASVMSGELKKELGLTDDQTQKVYDAKLEKLNQKQIILEKYGNDKKKARLELKAVYEKFNASMMSILTTDQYAKWRSGKDKNGKSNMNDND